MAHRQYHEIRLACAKAAHEINRVYCESIGDSSQRAWEMSPEWMKSSALEGVDGILIRDAAPWQSHEDWVRAKQRDGWKWGPVKDPDKKEHPCMVDWPALPDEQQKKDELFRATVIEMAAALGFVRRK